MSNQFGEQQVQNALRQYEREFRLASRFQNPMRGLAVACVLIALLIAFLLPGTFHGVFLLALLLAGLALAVLVGSISTFKRTGIYSGLYGFVWLFGIALCLLIGFWPWILLPVAASMVLGSLFKLILGGLTPASYLARQQYKTSQEGGQ